MRMSMRFVVIVSAIGLALVSLQAEAALVRVMPVGEPIQRR